MEEPFLPSNMSTVKGGDEIISWGQNKRPHKQMFHFFPWALSGILFVALVWVSRSHKGINCDINPPFEGTVYCMLGLFS